MTQFKDGNQIELLRNGSEYFPALEAAILAAKQVVYLQTYIFALDETGEIIGNALKQAAQRGVEVNLMLDGFGSKDLSKNYVEELKHSGVQVMFYRPKISPWTFKTRRLRRLHRKVAVIDDRIGFVGGINIIDDYDVPNQIGPRVDYAVRIEGAIVADIVDSVKSLWPIMEWMNLRNLRQPSASSVSTSSLEKKPNLKATFLIRNNVLHRNDIEDAYLAAIKNAHTEILIANAYFLPGKKFRRALIAASLRGVSVKLLLQGRKEYFLMFATHAFYKMFLKAGIEIFEYRKSFMHSKVAVIDAEWTTIGSSNIDPFSLLLSLEANVVVKDAHFAAELKHEIETSIANAYMITANDWAQGSKLKQLASWVAYTFVRFFLGVIGYSND
jgi:cardiolipin synthase